MATAASWRQSWGVHAHTQRIQKMAIWFPKYYLRGTGTQAGAPGTPIQTAAHVSTCDRLAKSAVQTCSHRHTCLHYTHIHTKNSRAASSHTSKELAAAAESGCRDGPHPIMINHIPTPKTNSQPGLTALRWTPQTKQASGSSRTHSLPHGLWTHTQEVFTNLAGLRQVYVLWNYV